MTLRSTTQCYTSLGGTELSDIIQMDAGDITFTKKIKKDRYPTMDE